MAEIGALEVSLSLNAASFNGSIAQVNRQMTAMGSELRALSEKGDTYGRSVDGLGQKQNILSRQFEAAGVKLQEQRRRYDELVASGTASEAAIERQANAVNRAQADYNRLERQLSEVTNQLRVQSSQWTQTGQQMQEAGNKLKSVGDSMTSVGKKLSLTVTAPITAMGAGAFKAAVDFESAFAGVRKTVDTSEEGFKKLEQGIRDMAKQLPASASDIAAVAESAGQLGIAEDKILSFSRTIIDLGESTNMTREQAATEFARFANIVGMSQDNFDRLGSSIVGLGNTMATTESEIMSMGMRLAAQGKQVGMSEAQIMALAGTMSSLGIQAEMGGTAMTTVLKKMQGAIMEGGASLGTWAEVAQMSSSEFKKLYDSSAIDGLDAVVKGLATISSRGENLSDVLKDMGIKGIYESDVMMRMAGASDLLSSAVATSTEAWKENTALSNEAAQRYATTASQLAMLKNKIVDIGITLGNILIPMVMSLLAVIEPWIEKFASLSEGTQKLIVIIAGIAAAIGPIILVVGTLLSSIGTIITTFGTLALAIGEAGGIVALLTAKLSFLAPVFTALTGPIGLTVAAIAGLTVGAIAFTKHMSNDALPTVERFGKGVSDSTKEALNGFFDLSEGASQSVTNMYMTSTEVTSDMAKEITSQFDKMNKKIVDGMKKRNSDQLSDMQEFFMNSSALTSEEEQKIIADTQRRNEWELQEQNAMNENVKAIIQKAADEKRELTEREHEIINNYNRSMKENAVRTFSESELEQKVILERMKENASIISAEQAAEVVKNAVKQKDEVVKEANETFEKRMASILQMRDETGAISAEQADKMIAEATKAKDQTIYLAEEQHQKIVETAQKQAEEHVDKVNWETGEILSKWEVFKNKHSEIFDMVEEYYKKVTDSLKEITSTAYEYIKSTVEEYLSEVVEFMKEQLDRIKEFWDENGEAILALVKEHFERIKSDIKLVMGLIKGIFEIVWPVISGIVKIAWETIKLIVRTALDLILGTIQTILKVIQGDWKGAWETISKTVREIWGNIEKFFKDVDLIQIGKDIINGLIKGIGSMTEAVWKKVEDIADGISTTAKRILGIKSPSRVMMEVGRWTGEGLAVGIGGTKSRVQQSIEDLGGTIIDVAQHYLDEEKKITATAKEEISKIEKRSKEDIDKIYRSAYAKKRQTTQDENVKIQRIKEDAAKKIADIEAKAAKQSVEFVSKNQKDILEEIKLFIQDKKTLEELNLVEEAALWNKSISLFTEGTKERIEVQKAYQTAVQAINKEIASINTEYSNQVIKINEDLIKSEEALNKAYEDAVSKRESSLVNFKGIFDEFRVEIDKTGEELMSNLQSQVLGFEEWQRQIDLISNKAIDKGLLDELRQMGPNALPQLLALNSLTEKQLTEYSDLYAKKSKLARKQAEDELKGMKDDTEKQIRIMRNLANAELDDLRYDWQDKIKAITKVTSTELSSLKQVGIDAGQGLLDGLSSMEGALNNKAKSIANSIKNAIQSALDIHSPSRVMRGFGVNIGQGLILGMDDTVNKVAGAAQRLASTVEGNISGSSTSTIDKSRSYTHGDTHIHVHGNNLTASEIARKNTQAQRQLAMEWGMA